MNDLINEIGQKSRMLDAAIRELGIRGRAYAQAEHDYRIALAEKTLLERDKGTPVTLCPACHRAYDEGANLERFGKGTTRESLYCYLVAYLKGFYPDWSREDMIYRKGGQYGTAVGYEK